MYTNPFLITSAVATTSFLVLAMYMYSRCEPSDGRDSFLLLLAIVTAWALGETGMRATGDAHVALLMERSLVAVGTALIGPGLLHTVHILVDGSEDVKGIRALMYIYAIPFAFLILTTSTDLVVSGVVETPWGYTNTRGQLYPLNVSMIVAYLIFSILFVFRKWIVATGRDRRIMSILIAGMTVPVVVGVTTDVVLPGLGVLVPEMGITSVIALVVAVAYAIKRHEIFEVRPVTEIPEEKGGDKEDEGEEEEKDWDLGSLVSGMEGGHMYYVDEDRSDMSLEVFRGLLAERYEGLALVRMNPDVFSERTGLEKTPVLWLSATRSGEYQTIAPSNISRLFSTVNRFLTSARRPVIFLEGIENLVFVNNFREIMTLVHNIYERMTIEDAISIMPMDKKSFSDKEWAFLKRNMREIGPVSIPGRDEEEGRTTGSGR